MIWAVILGVKDGERTGRLRSRCNRRFHRDEWSSLAGFLFSNDDAMAVYRTRPSCLDCGTSLYSAAALALAAQGQDERFLHDRREPIVSERSDVVS